jgi:hypothetical protein
MKLHLKQWDQYNQLNFIRSRGWKIFKKKLILFFELFFLRVCVKLFCYIDIKINFKK